ncbi:5a4b5f1f-79d7-4163-a423-ad6775f1c09d [Thermothielavioides terrestris]|uniref:5a4b5f1f-79d7-4163-a423-ad6775f1c09d n=1 Tax=Thermothielavioides terrestris TaxID=2587410 RepID=A0A3S5CXW0_9PEZI|nr:5a4b5f1f-79d7-4163-a423-ad6775f1c09d [Thermothielavioides terrestris]
MWPAPVSIGAVGQSRCRGCDHPRPPYNGGYASVRSSLGTMLSNAKYAGCEVCAILSDGILKFLADPHCGVAPEDVDQVQIDFNLAGSRRSLEVMLLHTPVKLCFFASEATPWITNNLPDLPLGKEVPQSTSSDESLSWAMQQLQACRQSHEACNGDSPTPLPSRVLDVFAEGESGVRLYESRGETAPYVCLSHCWGRRPFLRTLSGSLDAHRAEILWWRLPRTFQDAVEFTRKLGIRYLWIDSLCIVQDDQHDWRREAARMASIFQGAELVISAAKSQGANGGLYAELPPTHRAHTVRFCPGGTARSTAGNSGNDGANNNPAQDTDEHDPDPRSQAETIHVRRALTHTQRLLSRYHAPPSILPIFTRGWVLQERFLSRRILHFGPEELSFECLESATCQCTPTPTTTATTTVSPPNASTTMPAWYAHLLDRSARPKHYYSPRTWREGMDAAGRARCWRCLVEDYTRLRLTFDKDVFPAIAGLAQRMAEARGPRARYFAGLWGWEQQQQQEEEKKEEEGSGRTRAEGGGSRDVKGLLDLEDLLWHVELPTQGYGAAGSRGGSGSGGVAWTDPGGGEEEGWETTWMVRPASWRAPSWSWASVRAPVEFVNSEEGVQAECEVVERENDVLKPWNLIDLDILDGGHLKNLWADDDCQSLLAADGQQPTVYCLLVGRKLPRKELLCLVLARVPQDDSAAVRGLVLGEDGHVYRRIGLVEIFGGPPSPVAWGWVHNLLGKGEDAVVRIV